MTHKIYLIKHLDTGMGYVGITGDELGKRWYQHLHDPASAVYKALRAEGHRITMELLEEVESRGEALIKEQQYIHSLGTAQPTGWNRQVKPIVKPKPKRWEKVAQRGIKLSTYYHDDESTLVCPICFKADGTCDGTYVHVEKVETIEDGNEITVRIHMMCESCDCDSDGDIEGKPRNYIELYTTHGQTTIDYYCYREDKS